MSDLSLDELEREVENARVRLSRDLSMLRSPATISAFRHELREEAVQSKDMLIQRVQSTAKDYIQQLKAKAAANPAAALVIGAGLAWRLIRNPPIASVLVGAGVFSLLRATPRYVGGRGDVDYFAEARTRLREQASDLMDEVKERGSAVATEVAERAREFTHEAMHKAQEFSAAAPEQLRRTAGFNNPVCHNQTDTSLPPEPIESTFASGDQNAKNQLLLGTAGLAIVLALGISFRRRFIEN